MVGCSLDTEKQEIRYYLNGKDLGAAFEKDVLTSEKLAGGLYITCSFGVGQGAKINLGDSIFTHGLPEGFTAVHHELQRSASFCASLFRTGISNIENHDQLGILWLKIKNVRDVWDDLQKTYDQSRLSTAVIIVMQSNLKAEHLHHGSDSEKTRWVVVRLLFRFARRCFYVRVLLSVFV